MVLLLPRINMQFKISLFSLLAYPELISDFEAYCHIYIQTKLKVASCNILFFHANCCLTALSVKKLQVRLQTLKEMKLKACGFSLRPTCI